jgi:hypothetical protein
MHFPQFGQAAFHQQSQVRLAVRLAQGLNRGHAHHGIANPVDAAHQDVLAFALAGVRHLKQIRLMQA